MTLPAALLPLPQETVPNNRSLEVASEMRVAASRAIRSYDSSTIEIIMNRVSQLRRQYGNSVTCRKVDLVVESPLGTLNKLVGDLTIRHPTAPSNIAFTTNKFCTKVALDTLAKRSSVASPQVMDLATSRTFTSAERTKRQAYQVLFEDGKIRAP